MGDCSCGDGGGTMRSGPIAPPPDVEVSSSIRQGRNHVVFRSAKPRRQRLLFLARLHVLLWCSVVLGFQRSDHPSHELSHAISACRTRQRRRDEGDTAFRIRGSFCKVTGVRRRNTRRLSLASSSSSSSRNDFVYKDLDQRQVEFELHPSISSIPAEAWDSFLAPDGSSSPFMEHAWLRCLEESECASPQTGWVPQHLSVKIDGQTSVFVPLYLKGHSMGEFIFDNGWAEAAYQNKIQYYPKLLVGVPFTPASGNRILLHPDIRQSWPREEVSELRVLVGKFLKQIAISNKLSSVHLNFITDEEASDISGPLPEPKSRAEDDARLKSKVQNMLDQLTYRDKDDYLRRTSMQYHWANRNAKNDDLPYESFEDYLGAFKSKRRITIRRERRVMEEKNVRIDAVVGTDILKYDGLVERMFEIYVSTVDKMIFGRQYLTVEFFQMLVQSDFAKNLCFMCARPGDAGDDLKVEEVFAGTFNIISDGVFYGRYWGCLPGNEVKNLHFEACYWKAIEHCITTGLRKMEPGAGGGDYKWARGFDPALINSAHYICHPGLRRAVSQFLDYETTNNVEVSEYLSARSVVGQGGDREEAPESG